MPPADAVLVYLLLVVAVVYFRHVAQQPQSQQFTELPIAAGQEPALIAGNLQDYPVEIESADFMRTTLDFFERHPYKLGPSAPGVLRDFWWEIADQDRASNSLWMVIRYNEFYAKIRKDVPFELRMRLQLVQPGPNRYLQVGWSYTHRFEKEFDDEYVPWDHPSQVAEQIINYTIDELRLELLAVARAKNPALVTTLQEHLIGAKQSGSTARIGSSRFVAPIVAKVFWPSPQDYNEAMQNPGANLSLPILKRGKPELTPLGLPRACSGAFASVYKLNCGAKDYAIKCFLTLVHDQKDRYEMISRSILNDDLDYTVDFEFIPDGILIRGKWYPILRMDWVVGEPLNQYVERHLEDPPALRRLADNFVNMMVSIRRNGIAHGDLQHGNILVTEDGIRLVDYDGMFVPGMEGMVSNEIGHRNYQHPKRDPTHFGPWLDNFAAWVIYISLRVLASDPQLWHVGAAGDEALLFRQSDFRDPDQSSLIAALSKHPEPFVKRATDALVLTLQATPDQVPYLDPN